MTEEEWLAGDDISELFGFLRNPIPEAPLPERKSRLFGLACCDRIRHLVIDPRSLNALSTVERYAESLATKEELTAAFNRAFDVGAEFADRADECLNPRTRAAFAASEACHPYELAEAVAEEAARAAEADARPSEIPFQVALLRDIFGNPFRPVTFSDTWRTEHTVGLASQMYETRNFTAMPFLADALEEAGCDNAEILLHCRGDGPHVRGCWVVDLVLGKE